MGDPDFIVDQLSTEEISDRSIIQVLHVSSSYTHKYMPCTRTSNEISGWLLLNFPLFISFMFSLKIYFLILLFLVISVINEYACFFQKWFTSAILRKSPQIEEEEKKSPLLLILPNSSYSSPTPPPSPPPPLPLVGSKAYLRECLNQQINGIMNSSGWLKATIRVTMERLSWWIYTHVSNKHVKRIHNETTA